MLLVLNPKGWIPLRWVREWAEEHPEWEKPFSEVEKMNSLNPPKSFCKKNSAMVQTRAKTFQTLPEFLRFILRDPPAFVEFCMAENWNKLDWGHYNLREQQAWNYVKLESRLKQQKVFLVFLPTLQFAYFTHCTSPMMGKHILYM